MKNTRIGEVLKEYRKRNCYSVSDIAALLHEKDILVAEKTIYGWESGQSMPDPDTFLKLCEIYKIDDVLGVFGYTDRTPLRLTEYERNLLLNLRRHPEMLPAIK